MGTKVLNHLGRMIDPLNLVPADFENIGMQCAVTLSRVERFWGQCTVNYSVAQHCLSMVEHFEGNIELQRESLSHELYEGLTGMDVPSPIKHSPAFKPYVEAENRALRMFAELHGMELVPSKELKKADKDIMVMEALALMPHSTEVDWRSFGTPIGKPYKIGASQEEIKRDFLAKWIELFGGL